MVEETRRRMVLCADDYGLNEGTSRGILQLAEAGRISATSCMTNAPAWRKAAPAITGLSGRIGLGLHLTFTWGRPLGSMPDLAPGGQMPPLKILLRRSLTGSIPVAEIEAEIERQFDAFVRATGRAPDFVDGHQHAHILPGLRGSLLSVLQRLGLRDQIWLRDPADRIAAILGRRRSAAKALVIHSLAAGFRREAERCGFRTNRGFSGFSAFSAESDCEADMRSFLTGQGPAPLVMCHPGLADEAAPDEIEPARTREYDYLASEIFAALLEEKRLVLAPEPQFGG